MEKAGKHCFCCVKKWKEAMFSAFLDKDVYVFLHYLLSFDLVSVTEETEQVEEKVDEV